MHKQRDPSVRRPTPDEVVDFLENFRILQDPQARLPLKLISMKVDVPLLAAFKFKAAQEGVPYQTKIKQLMREWLAKK
jgi:predicted DNA binding CopG/RHH family protein